jgi:Planctomycete extracellular
MQRHARPARTRPNAGRLFLEPLEDRHLLSGTLIGPTAVAGPSYSAQSANASTLKPQSYSSGQTTESYSGNSYQSTDDDGSQTAYPAQQSQPNSPVKYYPTYDTSPQTSTGTKSTQQTGVQAGQVAAHFVATTTGSSGPQVLATPAPLPATPHQPVKGIASQLTALPFQSQLPQQAIVVASAESAFVVGDDRQEGEIPPTIAPRPGPDQSFPRSGRTGNLIAGTVPLDLAALERGIEEFFAHLDDLGQEITQWRVAATLTRWVVAAVFANATYELACWFGKPSRSSVVIGAWRLPDAHGLADAGGEEP